MGLGYPLALYASPPLVWVSRLSLFTDAGCTALIGDPGTGSKICAAISGAIELVDHMLFLYHKVLTLLQNLVPNDVWLLGTGIG